MVNKQLMKQWIKDFCDIELYPYQIDFLADCFETSRVCGCFSRQTGKSLCLSIFTALYAYRYDNKNVLIVAPTDRQAGELFDKIRYWIMGNPRLIASITNITQRECRFKNGSRIVALPTGDSGYTIKGFTADAVIEEEAALIKNIIDAEVIMPMGASRPDLKIIKISTPKGKNHFYSDFNNSGWKSHRVDWEKALEVGQYNKEFVEEQRAKCDSLTWKTEWCAEFAEEEDCYFSYELVYSCIEDIPQEVKASE